MEDAEAGVVLSEDYEIFPPKHDFLSKEIRLFVLGTTLCLRYDSLSKDVRYIV